MKKLIFEAGQTAYPIIIGYDINKELPSHLTELGITKDIKILIITDDNVGSFYLQNLLNVLNEFNTFFYVVNPGEASKSLECAEEIIQSAVEKGLDRSSVIIAFGGGMVGDLAGFVASIYMRGISFIQLPTTILAHDSSVGGKVGINHQLGKNLIGSFYQPKLVFYDTLFLNSLPKGEIFSGFAEVIKHSLIADKGFAEWLYSNSEGLLRLENELIIDALYKGILIKTKIVSEDEKEEGIRAILNYGHTLAHAIEIASNFKYTHGEAVSIGMVYACILSRKLGLINEEALFFTINLLKKFQLPISIPNGYDSEQLISILMKDKKFKNTNIRMILPTEIGKVKIVEDINKDLLFQTIDELKHVDSGGINETNN